MFHLNRMRRVSVGGLLTLIFVLLCGLSLADSTSELCGDVDGNAVIDISDLAYLVDYLFLGGPPPDNSWRAACDGTAAIDISDVIWLAEHLVLLGPPPICPLLFDHVDSSGSCLSHLAARMPSGTADRVYQSGCLDSMPGSKTAGEMHAELIDGNLHVYHTNAYYQCCLAYQVSYSQDDRYITALEADTGQLCDCICHFNLESVWTGLYPYGYADWIVVLIGIEGDTVGVDTIPLNGTMIAEAEGHDLRLSHLNARLNCCPAYYVEYSAEGRNIRATECDSLNACSCYCFYNTTSTLRDLPPGEFVITMVGGHGTPYEGATVGVDTVIIAP